MKKGRNNEATKRPNDEMTVIVSSFCYVVVSSCCHVVILSFWTFWGRGGGGGGAWSHQCAQGIRHPGSQPGAPATQRRCLSAPGGSSTQWVTAGAPGAPCGKEWWGSQGKGPPTKPGWAEPRTTARSQCSVNHPGRRARGAHTHGHTERQFVDGLRTEVCGQQQQSNDPGNNQHNPQDADYWAPLTRKRHILPHPAQPQHTNHWAPRTRKRHRQEHRPQRPTERSDPTQHAKGRAGDCPGPRKETAPRRTNVTQGGGGGLGRGPRYLHRCCRTRATSGT